MPLRAFAFFFAIGIMVASTPIAAQDSAFGNLAGDFAIGDMIGANMENQMGVDDDDDDDDDNPQRQKQRIATILSPAVLSYKLSLQRRQENYRLYAQATYPKDAAKREQAIKNMTQPDVLNDLAATLAMKYNLNIDNMADAYTYNMVRTWQVVNSDRTVVTKEQFAAVRRQVFNSFISNQAVARLTDGQKQQMAESWWLDGYFYAIVVNNPKNSQNALASFAKIVAPSARRKFGIDLTTLTLGNDGFVPKTGSKQPR
jgi:hypothetical protein